MVNLNLYGKDEVKGENIVCCFCTDFKGKLELKNCDIMSLKRGQVQFLPGIELISMEIIKGIEIGERDINALAYKISMKALS